ncbi:hypothetical protein KA183_20130 [bacterium]|nr:hypothetical protein [bacterium]
MRRILLCIGMISTLARGESCPIRTTDDVVACVVSNHPNVLDLNSELLVSEAEIEKARQRPNPNLSSELLAKNQGDILLGASYFHTIERGEKLEARLGLANTGLEVSRSKIRNEMEQVAIETLSRLFAIAQIDESCELIHEILSIYDSGLAKYNKQQYPSPELEVERDILKVAREEMLSRESINNSAKLEHISWLKLALGQDLPKDEKVWVPGSGFWKKSNEAQVNPSSQSIINESYAKEAASRIALEEASAYSDIGVGPSVEIEIDDNEWKAGIGIGISIDLPVIHRNEGAILVARKQAEAAQMKFQRQRDFEQANLTLLQEKYTNAVTRLEELEKNNQSKRLHKIIDQRSNSGLFRPQTIIEAHRQMVESLERKQEIELIALSAKWKIAVINGNLIPVRKR